MVSEDQHGVPDRAQRRDERLGAGWEKNLSTAQLSTSVALLPTATVT